MYQLGMTREVISEERTKRIFELSRNDELWKEIMDRRLWQYNCPCCNAVVEEWNSKEAELLKLPENAPIMPGCEKDFDFKGIFRRGKYLCGRSNKWTIQQYIEYGPTLYHEIKPGYGREEIKWYKIYLTDVVEKRTKREKFDPSEIPEGYRPPAVLPAGKRRFPLTIRRSQRAQKIFNYSFHCPCCNGINTYPEVPESVEVPQFSWNTGEVANDTIFIADQDTTARSKFENTFNECERLDVYLD